MDLVKLTEVASILVHCSPFGRMVSGDPALIRTRRGVDD